MSEFEFIPLPPLLANVGVAFGLRAALMLPRGAEESVIFAVVGAAEVERERGERCGGSIGMSGM